MSIESAFAFIEKIALDHQLQAEISKLLSGDDDAVALRAG